MKGVKIMNNARLFKGWTDFKLFLTKELFESVSFSRSVFLFRGQGSSNWNLTPSFDRWYNGETTSKVKVADQLLDVFKKEAVSYGIDRTTLENKMTCLALAQHHGLPTRLLDWTDSPYIAAFFAFAGIKDFNKEENVAIWCLDTRSDIWTPDFGVQIIDVPTYDNERLRNQCGKFTLQKTPFGTLEEYVNSFKGHESALIPFLIPSTEVKKALADLDLMGINHKSMYPGLESCARVASMRILLDY